MTNDTPDVTAPNPAPTTRITIVVNHADGSIEITGPIDKQMFMLGVLEQAKITVISYNQKQNVTKRKGADILIPKLKM